ncbi:hypothetical protein Aple_093050 [Acrocarpospora pleiomorpha]|uniref:Uncharacterized protein n=1 Tax=Acrocarpospora pleiomorpha TaxID=90975 RepID=A0A5M3XZP9_9ACTN|nr:hypothetical protein [Acrocarpospora pleiomorpha]GES26406.1 hypothetical protein Aple_093050 [Acrocarpospora pleiomorpha]
MESINMSSPSWLATARAGAAQAKLRQEKAFRPEAFNGATLVPAHAPASAYVPVFTDRLMGDAPTSHTANGGVQGPQYAWREPVTT